MRACLPSAALVLGRRKGKERATISVRRRACAVDARGAPGTRSIPRHRRCRTSKRLGSGAEAPGSTVVAVASLCCSFYVGTFAVRFIRI